MLYFDCWIFPSNDTEKSTRICLALFGLEYLRQVKSWEEGCFSSSLIFPFVYESRELNLWTRWPHEKSTHETFLVVMTSLVSICLINFQLNFEGRD